MLLQVLKSFTGRIFVVKWEVSTLTIGAVRPSTRVSTAEGDANQKPVLFCFLNQGVFFFLFSELKFQILVRKCEQWKTPLREVTTWSGKFLIFACSKTLTMPRVIPLTKTHGETAYSNKQLKTAPPARRTKTPDVLTQPRSLAESIKAASEEY